MPPAASRRDRDILTLREVRERQMSYSTYYTWNPKKKDTSQLLYKIERDPQTQETNLQSPKGGINEKFRIYNIQTLPRTK